MYLRELSGSKFHSVTSSNIILYNDVKNSIFINSGLIWFWNWALQLPTVTNTRDRVYILGYPFPEIRGYMYILGYPFPEIGGFRWWGMSIGTPWFYGSGGGGGEISHQYDIGSHICEWNGCFLKEGLQHHGEIIFGVILSAHYVFLKQFLKGNIHDNHNHDKFCYYQMTSINPVFIIDVFNPVYLDVQIDTK